MAGSELYTLTEQYNRCAAAAQAVRARAAERGTFSSDDRTEYFNVLDAIDTVGRRALWIEDDGVRELLTGRPIDPRLEGSWSDPVARRARNSFQPTTRQSEIFRRYAAGGLQAFTASEVRDMSLAAGSGGVMVPRGMYERMVMTQRAFGGFFDESAVTVVETGDGALVPVPLDDDTANAATIVSQGASTTTSTDPVFSSVSVGAFTYRTLVRVSLELLADSAFDLEQYLADRFAVRLWRAFNAHATNGTGTGQPQGLFSATVGANVGHVAGAGNTSTFPYLSLVALEHSVDPAYRASRSARWMFADDTLRALRQQTDANGAPLWIPDFAPTGDGRALVQWPGTILGYRYVINPDAPAMAANARCVAFGDFSYYVTRRVLGLEIVRAQERYLDGGQVGFYLFARLDGRFGNPSAVLARSPIRLGQNSAT